MAQANDQRNDEAMNPDHLARLYPKLFMDAKNKYRVDEGYGLGIGQAERDAILKEIDQEDTGGHPFLWFLLFIGMVGLCLALAYVGMP